MNGPCVRHERLKASVQRLHRALDALATSWSAPSRPHSDVVQSLIPVVVALTDRRRRGFAPLRYPCLTADSADALAS
jgi:hypothetical protein